MQLLNIELANFKCFKSLEFEFPQTAGLYLLTGNNLENPVLTTNAIGKSSLFDSVCWVLYGKTAKGRKAGTLLNRTAKGGYAVVLEFMTDGVKHRLARTWNPNNTQLDNVEVSQEQVELLIGLTFEQFLYSVYFPQHTEHFIDLSASEKLNFLSNLFQLDKWQGYADICKAKSLSANTGLMLTRASKDSKLDQLDKILSDTQELELKAAAWESAHITEVHDLGNNLTAAQKELYEYAAPDNSQFILELSWKITELNTKLTEVDLAKKEQQDYTNELSGRLQIASSRLSDAEQQMGRLKAAPEFCAACKQKLPETNAKDMIKELDVKIMQLKAELPGHRDKQLNSNEQVKKLEAERQAISGGIMKLEKQKSSYEAAPDLALEKAKMIKVLQTQLDNEIERINPYLEQIQKAEESLVSYDAELEVLAEQEAIEEKRVSQYSFWQKLFPQIRLEILKSVISELEIYFNQAFAQIGLFDWNVSISPVKELKNDSLKNELTLHLTQNGQEIDLDALSGGEKQRLRLSTALGISDLIQGHTGASINLSLFDEPFAAIQNFTEVIELLTNLGESRPVIVAEHHIISATQFAGIYELVKQPDGNTVLNGAKELQPCK